MILWHWYDIVSVSPLECVGTQMLIHDYLRTKLSWQETNHLGSQHLPLLSPRQTGNRSNSTLVQMIDTALERYTMFYFILLNAEWYRTWLDFMSYLSMNPIFCDFERNIRLSLHGKARHDSKLTLLRPGVLFKQLNEKKVLV